MADLKADTDATRSLTCRQCGESLHRFVQYDGVPYPPQEDSKPAREGTLDEGTRGDAASGDEPVGQPIWQCQRCRNARHGPDPDSDADQLDGGHSSESATGERLSDAMSKERSEILEISRKATEAERGELGELEHLVLNTMKTLDEGEGVDRERLVTAVQTDHTVSAADIKDAIESLLMRGECYELTNSAVKPL